MASKRRVAAKSSKKKAVRAKARPKAKAKAKVDLMAGMTAVTPYLCIKGAAEALEFYKKGFGARETTRMTAPDGTIGHAEIRVSGAPIMLSDEWPNMGVSSPTTLGGSPVTVHVYVKDVDAFVARALAAGATPLGAVENMPYGDRQGTIQDPFGHRWMIATRLENVSKAALRKRFGDAFKVT